MLFFFSPFIFLFVYLSTQCLFFFASLQDDWEPSEKRKIAFSIAKEFSKDIEQEYGMKFCGISEAAPKGKYQNLGIDFYIFKKLSLPEARKVLLALEEDFLNRINSDKSLEEYLLVYPFTGNNVVISIFCRFEEEPELYFPDYSVFSIYNSTLHYGFRKLNNDGSKSNLKFNVETKEEALELLDNPQ